MDSSLPTTASEEREPHSSPAETTYPDLKPRDLLGFLYLVLALGLTGLAIGLSLAPHWALWLAGQILLSLSLLQWFCVLHEAGHKTLFRSGWLNRISGYLAGFFALIPFDCWKLVHARHHRWTGWQDMDATTATLVPRRLHWLERTVINLCWKLSLPLFSTIYRLTNYWHLPRLFRFFPRRGQRWRLGLNIAAYLAAYGLLIWLVGPLQLLQLTGAALFLTLVMQDPLILSQHTHIPMQLSHGEPVLPFSPKEQEVFTRSLLFPLWFSRWILINLDAHELHHVHTSIPGYYLHKLGRQTQNGVSWWRWLLAAKRVPGDVFLYQNRNQTGFDI
jgi:omega-6 fatty acid desaturase (delta-12 desaturase)